MRLDSLFIASSSLAALQLAQALPVNVRTVCPPIIPCGAFTALVVALVGKMRGIEAAAGIYTQLALLLHTPEKSTMITDRRDIHEQQHCCILLPKWPGTLCALMPKSTGYKGENSPAIHGQETLAMRC